MDGSAPEAILQLNGFCGCEECVDDLTIIDTNHLHIVEEARLIAMHGTSKSGLDPHHHISVRQAL